MKVFRFETNHDVSEALKSIDTKRINANCAVAMLRRSGHGQKDNYSEAVQLDAISSYAQKAGLQILAVFSIIESAKLSADRKIFLEIDSWIIRKKILHRIFYKTDRETRNLIDAGISIDRVRAGTQIVHYAHEGKRLDKDTPPSDFLYRTISAGMDSLYSMDLSHKVKSGQQAKARAGDYPGCTPPLGYEQRKSVNSAGIEKRRGAKLVPSANPQKIRQVQREFELRANGFSYEAIRLQIINEGFIPPSDISTYRAATIERRLKNPIYAGYFDWAGERYKGNHELIIPTDILKKVQNTQNVRGTYNKEPAAMFGNGWLRCATPSCGCNIVADPKTKVIKTTGETKTYFYYHCTNGKRVHNSLKGMNISESEIWNQLGKSVVEMSINQDWASQLANAMNENRVSVRRAIQRDIENFKLALAELRKREDRLYDRFDTGQIDQQTYNHQRKRLQEEQVELTHQMEKAQLAITDVGMETAQSILELAINAESLWKSRSPQDRKEFLDIILSNRALDGLTVRYELKKPFRLLSEMKGDENWRRG